MKNKVANIIVVVAFIVLAIVAFYGFNSKEKGLEKLEVFGQEIEVVEGKTVYIINMESAEIGCEEPIHAKYNGEETFFYASYFPDGSNEAYFMLDFGEVGEEDFRVSSDLQVYDLYVHVYFKEPLVVECESRER